MPAHLLGHLVPWCPERGGSGICYPRDVLMHPGCSALPSAPQLSAWSQAWSRGFCYLQEMLRSSQPDLFLLNPGGRGATQIRDKIGGTQQRFLKGFSITRNFSLLKQFPDSFNLTSKRSSFILKGRETFGNQLGSVLLPISMGKWKLAIGANEQ